MFEWLDSTLEKVTATEWKLALFVFLVILVSVSHRALVENHDDTHTYIHQAIAFSKGSVSIDGPVPDAAEKDGQYYVAFPPFPAVVLVPFVYLFGTGTKTLFITPVMAALIAVLAFRLAVRIGSSRETARWATLGLVFGTSVLLCLRYPVDTYFAHCCAVLVLLAALSEAFGRQRGLWIGFLLGFAVLSRQATILTVPFVWAILLLKRRDTGGRWKAIQSVAATGVGLAVCLGFYLYLNWLRFGSPFDFGYAYISEGGWYGYRAEHWGNFSWIYIPSNLVRLFVMGFEIDFAPPSYLIPTMGHVGTSITFASPFVFYALRGKLALSPTLNRIGWVCIGLTCLAVLSHKSAMGGWQINGLRYTLDFMPMLFVFLVLGLERVQLAGPGRLGKLLIAYAVGLNLVAEVVIPAARRLIGILTQ